MNENVSLAVAGRKIAFSTLVQYFGKIAQLFLAALTLKMTSRFLEQGHYGVYAAIAEYALFFSVAANLGIFANVVRLMAKNSGDKKVFMNALFLRVISAVGVFGVAIAAAFFSGADGVFVLGTMIFLTALMFDFVTSVCDGLLQVYYQMGRATVALIAGRLLQFGSVFWLTQKFLTASTLEVVPLFFGATLMGAFLTMLLSMWFVRKEFDFRAKIKGEFLINLIKISLPFGIINIANNLYFRFLPEYFGHSVLSKEQFGSFAIFFHVSQVLALFSTFLMFSVLPAFKTYLGAGNFEKAKLVYGRIWKILGLAGVAMIVGGSFFGPFLISLLTDKKYLLVDFPFLLPSMLILAAISYGYDLVLITLFAFEQDIWFLKRELMALGLAMAIFAMVFAVKSNAAQLVIIMSGAILGESFMVIAGARRVRSLIKQTKPFSEKRL